MDETRTLKLIKQVKQTISEYKMLEYQDAVLVGVSGGPDSVALLYILYDLREMFALRIGVAHLNHSLRMEESDRDERFVGSLSKNLGLPFFSEKMDVQTYRKTEKRSIEDAARRLRYQFLYNRCDREGFQKIAVGHTANDNAELVLMQLLRGSGSLGMGGMPPVRDQKIIRPLIHTLKKEVLHYLDQKGIGHVTDQSNEDTAFTRNRVRKILIPLIESSFNPNAIETLNRLSTISRCEEAWIRGAIIPVFENIIRNLMENQIAIDLKMFNPLHMAVKRRVIRMAIEKIAGELKGFTLAHVDAVIGLSQNKRGSGSLDLPHHVRAEINGVELILTTETPRPRGELPEDPDSTVLPFGYWIGEDEAMQAPFFIPERGAYLTFSKTVMEKFSDFRYIPKGPFVAYLNYDMLSFPLCVRSIRPGDRFSPLGMTGTQKLKKFFINQKVSPREREKGFVLESGGQIVWVAGHRMDHAARLGSETRNVLKVELSLA